MSQTVKVAFLWYVLLQASTSAALSFGLFLMAVTDPQLHGVGLEVRLVFFDELLGTTVAAVFAAVMAWRSL